MSKTFKYIPGDHWVECQRCGQVHRSSKVRKEWTGLIVCSDCWEPRHPQDFVRGVPDNQEPDGLVNPESPDVFVTVGFCTSSSAIAGYAKAGCAKAGDPSIPENIIPDGTFNTSTL